MAISARIDELQKKFDENPRRYFAPLANEYRKAGDLEEAIRICRTHLPQQPGHMSGHIVFGQALFESNNLDEARDVFQAALALDPENLIALRHLGDIARTAGDLPAARTWYQRVLDADPRNEEIATQLAALGSSPADATPVGGGSAGDTGTSGDFGGWGDINPEREEAGRGRSTESGAVHEKPMLFGSAAAEGALAGADAGTDASLPTLDFLSDAPAEPLQVEQSAEFDVRDFGASPAPAPVAPASPEPAKPPAEPSVYSGTDGIFGVSPTREEVIDTPRDLGLEVMEFVPPSRDVAPPAAGYSATSEGEVISGAAAETPAAFVTETMAELYLQQGFRDEALAVYRQLLAQNPTDDNLRGRVHSLERGGRSSLDIAAISDNVIEAAHRRQSIRAPRSIRSFFGKLAGRRVRHSQASDAFGAFAPYEPPRISELPAQSDDWHEATASPLAGKTPADEAPWESVSDREPYAYSSGSAPSEAEPYSSGSTPEEPDAPSEGDPDLPAIGTSAFAPPFESASDGSPVVSPRSTPRSVTPRSLTPHESQPQSGGAGVGGTLDQLFGTAGVKSGDDDAAATLAGAFAPETSSPTPAEGRPARTAATELSLDHVFRTGPQQSQPRRPTGGFSFDQFFSEGGAKKEPTPNDSGAIPPAADKPGDGGDIEQFHAWLEGLKKK